MKRIFILSLFFMVSPAFAVFTQWTSDIPNACGNYNTYYASMVPHQYTCAAGQFLPANTDGCMACPNGYDCAGGTFTFKESFFQGAVKNSNFQTQNAANICATNFPHVIKAEFVINQYTCAAGQFLPAYTDGCASCPSGYDCAGGTYAFNPTRFQGATRTAAPVTNNENKTCAKNHPHIITAVFAPNQHTCTAGYYMPANTDGCVICPNDSYCTGGTYAFNETLPQGAVSCDTGLFAPMGMWDATQCGRELHIGENIVYLHSVKKTSPSLHVMIGNNIYYGNMTTLDVPMSRGTARKMKLRFNDTTYSVYDDSVVLPEP